MASGTMSHPLQLWTMRAVSVPYLCEARGGDYQVFGASPFGAHGTTTRAQFDSSCRRSASVCERAQLNI